jgi:hypothetical protein
MDGGGTNLGPKNLQLTVPTCEVWASMGEPKSGRSGASVASGTRPEPPQDSKGRSAGRVLGADQNPDLFKLRPSQDGEGESINQVQIDAKNCFSFDPFLFEHHNYRIF